MAVATNPARRQALGNFIDPAAVVAMQNLELRARAVVQGFLSGIHRSPYHGFSVEFTEYRPYTSGDDTKYLDWKLFARSDRYYIKKYEDETNLRCCLLVDQSRSMAFGTEFPKWQYANTLAGTFAYFLHLQRDAVGVLTFAENIRTYLPPRYRPGHLRELLLMLDKPAAGTGTDLEQPLERIAQLVRKRGMMVLISDFLAPVENLERKLTYLRSVGHELAVFHVLDPRELDLAFSEPMLFEDSEAGTRLYIDPAAAVPEYQSRIRAHAREIEKTCLRLGVVYHLFGTNQPFEKALLAFLQARERIGKSRRR